MGSSPIIPKTERETPAYYTPLPEGLSQQELNALQYHRNNLDTEQGLKNPDGSMTTFYGSRMGNPEGGVMLFPTYWHGVKLEPRTAYGMARRSGIEFPSYPNDEIAGSREEILHRVMEADSQAYAKHKRGR